MGDQNVSDKLNAIRQRLNLTKSELPDDDLSVVLQTLLVAASSPAEDSYTLQSVLEVIRALGFTGEIDVFTAIPTLLPCPQDATDDLLALIAEECSAKELIIVLQEASEKLAHTVTYAEDEDEEVNLEARQVVRLLSLYAKVLPRLSKGKKTPVELLSPCIRQLEDLLQISSSVVSGSESQHVLHALSQVVQGVMEWAGAQGDNSGVKSLLVGLVTSTLEAFANHLGVLVARQAFREHFPRFVLPDHASTSSTPEDDPVTDLSMVLDADLTLLKPSLGTLILLTHAPPNSHTRIFTIPTLQAYFPVILFSVQTNNALPAALAMLIHTLAPLRKECASLPSGTTELLAHILPALASTQPDPELRHIIFRLLSLLLALCPPVARMQRLKELLTPTDDESNEGVSDQMRVAAIGLVKEAVLDSLSGPQGQDNEDSFASPDFMKTFAPLLFVPRFPRLSDPELELETFLESPEPLRLVEALGLYYVVLQRDKTGRTGIRSSESMEVIQESFVGKLKEALQRWNEIELPAEAEDAKMQLGILDMWVERVGEAIDAVKASERS